MAQLGISVQALNVLRDNAFKAGQTSRTYPGPSGTPLEQLRSTSFKRGYRRGLLTAAAVSITIAIVTAAVLTSL